MGNRDKVVIEMKGLLEKLEPPLTSKCCIFKAPHDMRKLNEDAYTPKVISIGPFHHGKQNLQNMERYKLRYFKSMREKSGVEIETWVTTVRQKETLIRASYSDMIEPDTDKLVKLVLVDAGFVLELFWRCNYGDWEPDDNDCILNPSLATSIQLDLILLENQLPFSVLNELSVRAFENRARNMPSFHALSFKYFSDFNKQGLESDVNVSFKHFTDLVRSFYMPTSWKGMKRVNATHVHIPSASELKEAGMKINVSSSKCILDIKFERGVLEIPSLQVEDSTEVLFRNFVAFEQLCYPRDSFVTDYIALLDFLINTDKDVDVLVRSGIVFNWLGDSSTAANMFNGLWKNVTQVNINSTYYEICRELNEFYKSPCNNWKATLRRDYCNTPWKTVASIAGIVILILTLLQSVCSVIQVKQGFEN